MKVLCLAKFQRERLCDGREVRDPHLMSPSKTRRLQRFSAGWNVENAF